MIGRYFPMTCVLAGAMLGLGMLAGCRSQSALSFPTIAPGFPFQNNGPTTAVSYNARGVQRLQCEMSQELWKIFGKRSG